ncbi:NADH-quinone oxidoreductase subunit J [Arcobacter sp. F2176]|jgi:NADH-quinone oxidoreductase subunit J|uniref:NADH-quinone oxidoreductase subunit J family protein n=1 Tax=Arcobacter TaxID=28196 RepID=UPI00100A41EA|nr:NADH-quinone oxidoreductase subunit J [Arcobacter sp. F2176]RXJ82447.1 NADH-quinone oxidoreductase subunit J [Arcobacter sp. F2176]|tara:strand:+ start:2031 stop:2546 length:516 start_codon:yes stop_codon:yes gene_type:complete
MTDILFIGLSFMAIAGGITMLTHKQPMYAALGLLISILSVSGLFALLSATFLFMVQIIVYAGAIMTLLLFILMFLNIDEHDLPKEPKKVRNIIIGAIVMLPLNVVILTAVSALPKKDMSIIETNFGGIKEIGMLLYQNWLISFELISILLLVALVGAIVLAKRKKTRGIQS